MGEEPGDIAVREQTDPWAKQAFGGSVDFTPANLPQGCDEFRLVLTHDLAQLHLAESRRRPRFGVEKPIVGQCLIGAHRGELQGVTRPDHLDATEWSVVVTHPAAMEIEVAERPTREHRDFINDQPLATPHPVEGSSHVRFGVAGKLRKVLLKILPCGWSEQHPAPSVHGHASHVEGSHPGRGGDVRIWMTFEVVPHVVTFSRSRRTCQEDIPTGVGEIAELVSGASGNHASAHGSHAPPPRITQPASRPIMKKRTIIGQRRRGRLWRAVNPWMGKRRYADCG